MQSSLWVALAGALIAAPALAEEVTKPEVIMFGSTLEAMTEALAGECESMNLRPIDPPFLPDVEEIQQQIDCEGFDFLGEPRFAEFVVRDGILEMVWILVDADDQDRTIAAMREAYGADGMAAAGMIAFPEHRTAWRFEPPEVLFYSESLAPAFERSLEEAAN